MKIVLIGSGTMATSITQFLLLTEQVESLLVVARSERGLDKLQENCLNYLGKLLKRKKISDEVYQRGRGKLMVSLDYKKISSMNLVIEAVAESIDVKQQIFREIALHISKDTIVATNSSSLSITQLASYLPYPERALGLHFFNPATIMELVEIVVGHLTDKGLVKEMVSFIESLGKSPVVVNEGPGFVVNRMLIPMINEAIGVFSEGIASVEDIDKAMKLGARHPMGPLALSDLIGNDVTLSIMDTLHTETGDPKYRAHFLLRRMVRAGHLGRKTKIGFYDY